MSVIKGDHHPGVGTVVELLSVHVARRMHREAARTLDRAGISVEPFKVKLEIVKPEEE